eukprot:1520452-Pyramimonas_sp.AAC.1
MNARANPWIEKWTRQDSRDQLEQTFREVRESALEAPPLPPLDPSRLDRILQNTPERKSRGCINNRARDISRLPPSARSELLDIFT